MADDYLISLGLQVDTSQVDKLNAASAQAKVAGQQMASAFNDASAGMVNFTRQLLAAGLSANDVVGALRNQGVSARDAKQMVDQLTGATAELGTASETAAVGVSALGRALGGASNSMSNMSRSTGAASSALYTLEGSTLGATRAAGLFLTQVAGLGPLIAKAFPVIGAIALAEAVKTLIDRLVDATTAIAGWDAAAQKAYDNLISKNNELYLATLRQYGQMQQLGTVGTTSILKNQRETEGLTAELKRYNDELAKALAQHGQMERQLEQQKSLRGRLQDIEKSPEGATGLPGAIAKWHEQSKAIDEASAHLLTHQGVIDQLQAHVKELQFKLNFGQPADYAAEIQKIALEVGTAKLAAEKQVNSASISFQEQGAKEMLALGQTTQQQETAALLAAETTRYTITKENIEKRRALALQTQEVTGKPAGPALEGLEGEAETEEISHQARISAIQTSGRLAQQRLDEQFARADAAALKQREDTEASELESGARRMLDLHQISEEAATGLRLAAEQKRFAAEQVGLQSELEMKNRFPLLNAAEILRINQQIESNEIAHQSKMAEIVAEGEVKRRAKAGGMVEEEVQATERSANAQLSAQQQLDNARLQHHDITLRQWEQSELDAINRWYVTQRTVLMKALDEARTIWGENSVEYQRLNNKLVLLDQKHAEDVQKVYQKIQDTIKASYDKVTGQINSAINGWITGHTTLQKALQQLWQSIINDILNKIEMMVEKWIWAHIIMAAIAKIFGSQLGNSNDQSGNRKQALDRIEQDKGQAEADVFLQAIESVPFPENLAVAPAVAALVGAQMSVFSAQAAGGGKFHQGGIAGDEMVGLLRKNEMVLPEHISNMVQRAAGNYREGDTISNTTDAGSRNLHVHMPPVSAFDAEGVDRVMAKHKSKFIKTVHSAYKRGQLKL